MRAHEKWLLSGLLAVNVALLAAVLRPRAAPTPLANSPDARAELLELQAQVRSLQRDVAALQRQALPAGPQRPEARDPDGGAARAAFGEAPPPRYLRFEGPGALHIEQVESGDLRVTNTDPALSGHLLTIQAYDADGGRHALPVLVPPPGT